MPRDPRLVAQQGPFFLEVFAGTACLTQAARASGLPCLPPIDISVSQLVPVASDVLDADFWEFIIKVAQLGGIFFTHCGTPCNTFSAARKLDGGPPPLRSAQEPIGLAQLSSDNEALVLLGNLFLLRSVELCLIVFHLGGDFSIENPLQSLLWATPPCCELQQACRAIEVDFDQCAFGAPSMKPTRLLVSSELFGAMRVHCPGNHHHEVLKGKVWNNKINRWVFKTKQAQVYPEPMCTRLAEIILRLHQQNLDHLEPSFRLSLAASERKRPLGLVNTKPVHRQAGSALLAQHAGYQMKRGALKPLIQQELEPGAAIKWSLEIPHPFTELSALPNELQNAITAVTQDPQRVQHERVQQLMFWEAEAHRLLPESDRVLRALPDPHLRKLLRGAEDHEPPLLGRLCHIELYRAMLAAVHSVDQRLPDFLLHGFPIVGDIASTGRWPPFEKPQKALPVQHALDRAWEIRKKIVSRVASVPVTENLQKIWDATIEDVQEGSSIGPFRSEAEVTSELGSDDWIPTQRFEVVQKNKVRGCDSATTNLINQITVITEKLQLPSTDVNVSAIRALRSAAPWKELGGWVLDERKAYRQVAIRPDHRKFSVICLKDPSSGVPNFFIMIGHSFGLVSAVYNYNRRSAALNEILVSLFKLVAFSFYDDKYGFEPLETVTSARLVAECVHLWLGAKFDQKKLQLCRDPTILGVTYDLERFVLLIKAERRIELLEEIDAILRVGLLDPGSAGKLKGKLMFGASQLWGKVGRAFLRVISERQYARFPPSESFNLDDALVESLSQWRSLVESGPPRPIDLQVKKQADAVIFTDGFTPDPREAVIFDRRLLAPRQFTAIVPAALKETWLVRQTQIVPVEMVVPIVALFTFKDRVRNSDLILLIDSESVEGALIKGYSSKTDVCKLVSVFWELALELRVRVFIDRISTDANPADWPSRGDLERGARAGWTTIEPVWPPALRHSR